MLWTNSYIWHITICSLGFHLLSFLRKCFVSWYSCGVLAAPRASSSRQTSGRGSILGGYSFLKSSGGNGGEVHLTDQGRCSELNPGPKSHEVLLAPKK
eukprot:4667746-Amphidinium_carterae.1